MGLQTRCAATTVASKAARLLKWASYSSCVYSEEGNQQASAKCSLTAQYLRTTVASEKREARRCVRTRKNSLYRVENLQMLLLQDFEKAQRRAMMALNDLVATLTGEFKDRKALVISDRQDVAYSLLNAKDGLLLRKWCLNFLCAVVLFGGGQRAQVYSELALEAFGIDSKGVLVDAKHEVERCAASTGHFFLQAKFEKRLRSTRMPYVRMPASLFHIYTFHVEYARPAVLRRNKVESTANYFYEMQKPLLLNTENGLALESRQICSSVKRFFKNLDRELQHVTPLVIRRSYATIMFQRYLKGEIYSGKTRGQFLDFLAERLNTSVEQLEDVYCADEDIEQAISRLFCDE